MYPALLPLALLASQPVAASSPFNGTWLIDMASMKLPPEITTFSLKGGVFSRGDSGQGVAVKADGRAHAIAGNGYFDAVANAVSGGDASTTALRESTEAAQFVAAE